MRTPARPRPLQRCSTDALAMLQRCSSDAPAALHRGSTEAPPRLQRGSRLEEGRLDVRQGRERGRLAALQAPVGWFVQGLCETYTKKPQCGVCPASSVGSGTVGLFIINYYCQKTNYELSLVSLFTSGRSSMRAFGLNW